MKQDLYLKYIQDNRSDVLNQQDDCEAEERPKLERKILTPLLKVICENIFSFIENN